MSSVISSVQGDTGNMVTDIVSSVGNADLGLLSDYSPPEYPDSGANASSDAATHAALSEVRNFECRNNYLL